jgi:hypothetical protein
MCNLLKIRLLSRVLLIHNICKVQLFFFFFVPYIVQKLVLVSKLPFPTGVQYATVHTNTLQQILVDQAIII